MHNYISKCGSKQPPATVKQMAPIPEMPDPRLIEKAYRDLQAMNQPQMSQTDGVNITISIAPQQGDARQYVQQRSGDVLSQVLADAFNQRIMN